MRNSGQSTLAVAVVVAVAALVTLARPATEPSSGPRLLGSIEATSEQVEPVGAPAPIASSSPAPAASSTAPTAASSPSPATPAEPKQLPRGGTTIFPDYRLVGYSGAEGAAAFGRLGIGSLDARADEIERRARSFDGDRPVLPVLELITVVVQAHPGDDGKYRIRSGEAQIRRYLDAARRHRALLLLDIQPGRADMLGEVKALATWLKEPDVGVALDPEWSVGKGQVPGRVFGHTSAAKVNSIARYLSGVVTANGLPEKALVVHQLATRIIPDARKIKPVAGVATVISVDGIGNRAEKTTTWKKLVKPLADGVHPGFKLFFTEDRRAGKLMTPKQILALKPRPEYVLYE